MHAWFVQRFLEENRARFEGARVRRVACVADGLLLELETGGRTAELGLLAASETAWAYCLNAGARTFLHAELTDLGPDLVAAAPAALTWRAANASALDALRAWLVRPMVASPAWSRLEKARLCGMRARTGDRRLWLDFEASDALGRGTRLELVAELFDRHANFILRGEEELANWKSRRPAPDTRATPATEPTPQAAADPQPQRSLAAAAHLELAQGSARALMGAHERVLRRLERRVRARLERLEEDAARAANAPTWRRWGELLAANLHRAKRGETQLRVEDFYADGAPVAIDLDPQLSPQENVARFFQLARRGERGRARIEARLGSTRQELEALLARGPTSATTRPTVISWSEALERAVGIWKAALPAVDSTSLEQLWLPGGPRWPVPRAAAPRASEAAGPGRRFFLQGDWEVRVGRSNAENDELTHRFAHSDDIWLHASGVAGSHVVLRMQGRRDNPPRHILEAAAAIAARFSKAKHSGTVPVIWTRQRHVRKPRGAAPGLATCTHEKTLFVKPALPESVEEYPD